MRGSKLVLAAAVVIAALAAAYHYKNGGFELKGGDAEFNADALRALLDGAPGAFRDFVLINSAAALIVAGKAKGLRSGADMAAAAIDTGRARKATAKLA